MGAFVCCSCVVGCNVWQLVSYCIRSTLLGGGGMSGFCIFLHSLKATATCRPVNGKNEVERWTDHNISPLITRIVIFHNAVSRNISLNSAQTHLLQSMSDGVIGARAPLTYLWMCMLHCHSFSCHWKSLTDSALAGGHDPVCNVTMPFLVLVDLWAWVQFCRLCLPWWWQEEPGWNSFSVHIWLLCVCLCLVLDSFFSHFSFETYCCHHQHCLFFPCAWVLK